MFRVSIDKPNQIVKIAFCGLVTPNELAKGRDELVQLLQDVTHGFEVLTDLSQLHSMPLECALEMGKIMELCDSKGVRQVTRIIPDQRKDIGFNILSIFHYKNNPRIITLDKADEQ